MTPNPPPNEIKAAPSHGSWNEAYDRLIHFLETFALGDHPCVSRLALSLLDQARELHRQDPTRDPTALTIEQAQKRLAEWLATNLDEKDKTPSSILARGYIALLLSRMYRVAPTAFLSSEVPGDLQIAMRRTLVVTGPDLNISSMTPRHLDFGPMLDLAQQTWHRLDIKELVTALLFWSGVYAILYYAFSIYYS